MGEREWLAGVESPRHHRDEDRQSQARMARSGWQWCMGVCAGAPRRAHSRCARWVAHRCVIYDIRAIPCFGRAEAFGREYRLVLAAALDNVVDTAGDDTPHAMHAAAPPSSSHRGAKAPATAAG